MEKNYFTFLILPKYRIIRHCIFLCLLMLVAYFREVSYTPYAASIIKTTYLVLIVSLFYINAYWLVPKFLLKNRFVSFALVILFFTGLIYLILLYMFNVLEPYHLTYRPSVNNDFGVVFFGFIIIVLIGASTSVKLLQQWVSDAKLISELERTKFVVELEQLKNQINPHFLFNMLNNANVLTKKDPEKASLVLVKLSDLLRYQLYDSSREKVLLTSDIHFLEDFLMLEKVRRDRFDFMISKDGDLNGVQIPPLLFISFVENAVKHNNDTEKSSYINLYFNMNGNELFFRCENSKPLVKPVSNAVGGLGLVNIKRRLELLFPSSHSLKIEDHKDVFCVTLNIKL